MKTPTILATVTLSGALLFGASLQSQAQGDYKIKIKSSDPEFVPLQSPQVGGNTGKKKWSPKNWLEMEVEVELDAAGKGVPEDGHIDTLSVTWYVAVANKNGKKGDPKTLILSKTVTHVNIPIGEPFFLSSYLSPATVKRLTGSDRASKSTVKAVGGEINCPNAVEAVKFSNFRGAFWETKSDTVAESNRFPLLSKDETPFKFLWWDRYLEIRPATK